MRHVNQSKTVTSILRKIWNMSSETEKAQLVLQELSKTLHDAPCVWVRPVTHAEHPAVQHWGNLSHTDRQEILGFRELKKHQPSIAEKWLCQKLPGDNQGQIFLRTTEPLSPELGLILAAFSRELEWHQRLTDAESLAYRDDLTGLFNQRYMDIVLDAEIRRARRYDEGFSLLFMDLDNFKAVNDSFGHLVGSKFLKDVARVILSIVREVDVVIRFGGDEFVILLLGTDSQSAYLVADRIRQGVESMAFDLPNQNSAQVTASVGIACWPADGDDRESLLQKADESMYLVKKMGKNRVHYAQGTK